jgi:hypothetical protein
MMISKRGTPQAVEDQGAVEKAKYVHFFWPILRGIVLIVALYASIELFSVLLFGGLYGGSWLAVPGTLLANYALIWMAHNKRETLPAIEGEGTEKRPYRLPDWSLLIYWVIIGLGCNWVCAFLWFSRRYALFSGPVVSATGLIMGLYAAIALLVALLTGGNWRTALLVFVAVPVNLAGLVLSLRLLR